MSAETLYSPDRGQDVDFGGDGPMNGVPPSWESGSGSVEVAESSAAPETPTLPEMDPKHAELADQVDSIFAEGMGREAEAALAQAEVPEAQIQEMAPETQLEVAQELDSELAVQAGVEAPELSEVSPDQQPLAKEVDAAYADSLAQEAQQALAAEGLDAAQAPGVAPEAQVEAARQTDPEFAARVEQAMQAEPQTAETADSQPEVAPVEALEAEESQQPETSEEARVAAEAGQQAEAEEVSIAEQSHAEAANEETLEASSAPEGVTPTANAETSEAVVSSRDQEIAEEGEGSRQAAVSGEMTPEEQAAQGTLNTPEAAARYEQESDHSYDLFWDSTKQEYSLDWKSGLEGEAYENLAAGMRDRLQREFGDEWEVSIGGQDEMLIKPVETTRQVADQDIPKTEEELRDDTYVNEGSKRVFNDFYGTSGG
jgi:hypothetical protein